MPALLIGFVAAAVSGSILTAAVIRMAVARGIYDAPLGGRRVHTEPLPRIGGIAVFCAMAISLVVTAIFALDIGRILANPPLELLGILFGGTLVFITGLVDDLRGLRPVSKFVAQIAAALIVYTYGFRVETLSFGPDVQFSFEFLTLPVTIFWLVGVTNAFNLIDGLDGLAGGMAVVALGMTLTASLALGNSEVALVCAVLLGALLSFLRYNFNPAKIFLGDSGSLFVGFMLAVLSVFGAMNGSSAILAVVPLFALAVPLLDTSLAIMRRWLRGIPVSQADGRHVHHRLLALGLAHRHAVIVLYIAASVLAVLGLALVFAPPPALLSVAAGGGILLLLVLLWGLHRLEYHEFIQAGSVLATGVLRLRRVIRDQIHAHDVGSVISSAKSLDEVRAILEDNITAFGFLHMEVCKDNAPGPGPLVLCNGHAARAWKLDYPITPHDFVEGEDYVLRIWCNPQGTTRSHAAERVAQILAPVLERWMARDSADEAAAHAGIAGGEANSSEEAGKAREHAFPRPRVIRG